MALTDFDPRDHYDNCRWTEQFPWCECAQIRHEEGDLEWTDVAGDAA